MSDSWFQDVRFAVRLLRKSPLFVITAALSLAIGIGANTTIFSLAYAALMRPLPGLADPDRLVDLGRTTRGEGFDTVSHHYYRLVRERATTLSGVYAQHLDPTPVSLGGRAEAERVYGTLVSGSFFPTLGTQPVIGRLLRDDDDVTVGAHAVTVISSELWERRFNADPAIVGQTIILNGRPFTVVGVAPRGFQGTTILRADLWMPLSMLVEAAPRMSAGMLTEPRVVWLEMGGRLKPGVTLQQAQSEMHAIAEGLKREFPEAYGVRGIAVATQAIVPGQTNTLAGFMAVLMALVGLLLAIACVNVAGMMLARAAGRRREIAVRMAIGAGRGRLIRQLLAESLVVFSVAGLAGIILSQWLTTLLLGVIPQLPAPVAFSAPTDWRVVTFGVALSLVTAVLSGLAPALQASRADLLPALKTEGLEAGLSKLRLRNAFVIGQITMSLLLVITAGLFLRALQHAASINPGFDQDRVDVVSLELSTAGLTEETGRLFLRDFLERLAASPGIESASAAADLPLDGNRMGLGRLRAPGTAGPDGSDRVRAEDWNVVEPGYFRTLSLGLVSGRDFTRADTSTAPRVAIVNEAFAARVWPGRDAIGQRLLIGDDERPEEMRIIGVTANAHVVTLGGEVEPFIYLPMAQSYMTRMSVLVKTRTNASAVPQVRALLREMNPNLPITEALALRDITALGTIPQRIAASVAGSLGIVGLVLAAIGIYGVTAYSVSRRTREIGIRVALGADEGRVLRLVLRQGFVLAAIGVAIGVALAGIGSRLLESLLFGIAPLDPVAFGSACLLFAFVTVFATFVPARRATRVDPMTALRTE